MFVIRGFLFLIYEKKENQAKQKIRIRVGK